MLEDIFQYRDMLKDVVILDYVKNRDDLDDRDA